MQIALHRALQKDLPTLLHYSIYVEAPILIAVYQNGMLQREILHSTLN